MAKKYIFGFYYSMNLLDNLLQYSQIKNLKASQISEVIDNVTYKQYEDSNPFENTFDESNIQNEELQRAVKTTKVLGSEVFSALTNPFYLTHKVLQIPTYYKTAAETYEKITNSETPDKP